MASQKTNGYKSGFGSIDFSHNLKKILGRVSAEEILNHYGARNVYRNGDEWIHSCLIDKVHPHHSNGDEEPSAALKEGKLLYSCFSYGGGDILWLIQELEDVDRNGAFDILSTFMSERWDDENASVLEAIRKIMKADEALAATPTYSPIILRPWQAIHPYLTDDRELNEETLKRYQVGYNEKDRVIILPHFWQGNLVGYQKRALTSDDYPKTRPDKNGQIPKYKNTPNFPKETSLFNYDVVTSRNIWKVVVVESVMSVLKAESFFDEGHTEWGNVLCTFGGKVTDPQIEVLRQFEEVTLFMDNDASGWSGTVHLYNGLKSFCKVYIVEVPKDIDLADLPYDLACEVLAARRFGPLVINSFNKRLEEVKR